MSREWKVGDRFSVEGVITETADSDGDYQAIFDGHTTAGLTIGAEMACAKLIKPAEGQKESALDVTKPMRFRGGGTQVAYIDRTESGLLAVRDDHRCILLLAPSELENIPGPKRTYEQIVELVPFSDGLRIVSPGNPLSYVNVASRAKVSYTDGEGWSVEEVL